ncbi:tRNA lysidine(34) synthetase TilS [Treponema brennaborense]|uniref:tRNA(Ile)-lysidine synthase n=1 Tax=Treponema brennaborense (strain DSM 12168 / CIP 105900 / DD5/3) TaxID=906968 RepID=F4LQI2_TREBD|nr:tRNA lysidine(34) synthetase TilS [Treponema brennaborense]AEE17191.1 tRNA(Ile)-lysidine synthase [Treponema brennaborense DSM 12168]
MNTSETDEFAVFFERRVMDGFSRAGYPCAELFRPGSIVAFGVSGGADSMALLCASVRIRESLYSASCTPGENDTASARFRVITVDHNIRPPEESGGDAAFVRNFCETLPSTDCRVAVFERGAVERLARERRRGLEEAARSLRYGIFESDARQTGAAVICLAHNRNDQLETLLLRFLQGSSAASGIPRCREPFVRPLLDIGRADILRYLEILAVPHRTDATNFDNRYLRNKCRNELVPVLNSLVPGWDTAVLSGAEKAAEDAVFIDAAADSCSWRSDGDSLCMDARTFRLQAAAIKRRLIYRAFDVLETETRIPYAFVRRICRAGGGEHRFSVSAGGITVDSDGVVLCLRKTEKDRTAEEIGFYAVITAAGAYEFPFGTVAVSKETPPPEESAAYSGGRSVFVELPVVVRSAAPADCAYTGGGIRKSVSKICAEAGVPAAQRGNVPVIESYGARSVIPWTAGGGFVFHCEKSFSPSGEKNTFRIEIISEN